MELNLTGIFSLWTEGLVIGSILGAIPVLLGVLINFAIGLFKK